MIDCADTADETGHRSSFPALPSAAEQGGIHGSKKMSHNQHCLMV